MKASHLFTLVFLVAVRVVPAAELFVSPTGSDSTGTGSISSPFKTVNHASDLLQPGDTLSIRGGTYTNATYGQGTAPLKYYKLERTVWIVGLNGTAAQPITIRAYNNEPVVFKGDGDLIFALRNSSYVNIEGIECAGEVDAISMSDAVDYQFKFYTAAPGTTGAAEVERIPLAAVLAHYNATHNPDISSLHDLTPTERLDANAAYIYAQHYDDPALSTLDIVNNTYPNSLRPTYFATTGLLIHGSHHVVVKNCHVHHMPGVGLRFQSCNYFDAIGNVVHDNSRRGPVGNHGLVVHSANSALPIDDPEKLNNTITKIRLTGNRVYDNYNEVWSWSELKNFITPEIDEGKGISMQKNFSANGWKNGRILIANNITYGNGFSGVHINEGDNFDVINNTSYNDTRTGRGNNVGISIAGGKDCTVSNNIVVSQNTWGGFALAMTQVTGTLVMKNNLVQGSIDATTTSTAAGTVFANPLFVNPASFDFHLNASSPAIGTAFIASAPLTDFFGTTRDAAPDRGAVEYVSVTNEYTAYVQANTSLTGPDALPEASPFGDGVENLAKYAFNMDLNGNDSRTLIEGTGTSGMPSMRVVYFGATLGFRVELIRRRVTTLQYTLETSTTLGAGSWQSVTTPPSVTTVNATWERAIYDLPQASGAPRISLRALVRLFP